MSAMMTLLLLASTSAPFPVRAGACAWVKGQFAIYNGSSIQRLHIMGTRHFVALRDDDDFYPPALRRVWNSGKFIPGSGRRIFGAFKICAIEHWVPGRLQHVRLADVGNLAVR